MNERSRRTVAYVRVSSEDQADGFGLDDQRRACMLYSQSRAAMGDAGWSEIGEGDVYADPGISGAVRDRPGLNRLLADAKAGQIGRVVITKLDRVGRKANVILSIEDELDTYNVQRTYIKDSIDTSTPVGRMLRTVLCAVAELERDMILERTSAGFAEALRQGSVYRPHTLGYRYIRGNRKAGQLASVEVDPLQAVLVKRIFTHVANGGSLNALAKQLNEEQAPTLRGASYWRVGTLRKIIYNPLYQGQAAHGRTKAAKTSKGTSTSKPGDPSKIVYVDCPRIVSDDLARAAREQLARNKISGLGAGKTGTFLLGGGLLRCGVVLPDGQVCGSTMNGETRGGGKSPRYRCGHQTIDGFRRHTVLAKRIEGTVWDALRRTLGDTTTVLDGLRALSDASSGEAEAAAAELRTVERAMGALEAQRDALLDLHLAGGIERERFSAKDLTLQAQHAALAAQHAALAGRRNAAIAQQLPLAEIEDLCRRLAGKLDTLDVAGRYRLVHTLFTRVSTDQKTVHMEGVFDTLSMNVALETDGLETVRGIPRTVSKERGEDLATGAASSSKVAPPLPLPFTLTMPLAAAYPAAQAS